MGFQQCARVRERAAAPQREMMPLRGGVCSSLRAAAQARFHHEGGGGFSCRNTTQKRTAARGAVVECCGTAVTHKSK